MQTSAKEVGKIQRLHASDPLCNIIFLPRGESGLMSVCLPPCAPRATRRKWGSWIMIIVLGWQPLQRESMTFVTLLHHKCLEGEQLSPLIWLHNMNNKQCAMLNVFVGAVGLLGTGSPVAVNSLVTFCFFILFFFYYFTRGRKEGILLWSANILFIMGKTIHSESCLSEPAGATLTAVDWN